jgi:hypothetical protein
MYKSMLIEYGATPGDSITLEYRLRSHPVVESWVNQVLLAQSQYSIDDPQRFYGFGSGKQQQQRALDQINQCISDIDAHEPIIQRTLTDVGDQDTLNYLHHIFEVYHGLLDQQTHEFWSNSPISVRRALANLNIAVHTCESVSRGAKPRHVVTWFALPKTQYFTQNDYQYFTDIWAPGTVFLNYVEIGKTMEDLATDHDQYIHAHAFQPFRHFSADFVVRFFEQTPLQAQAKRAIIQAYYQQHRDFFGEWVPEYSHGGFPIADLISDWNPSLLESRCHVNNIYFQ